MWFRESIFVEKITFDFPAVRPVFNTKFPIFSILSILSFLFSYLFEQPSRWTPCVSFIKHNVSRAFLHFFLFFKEILFIRGFPRTSRGNLIHYKKFIRFD